MDAQVDDAIDDEINDLKAEIDREFDRLYERLKKEEEKATAVRWGGFFRRSWAFLVDIVVVGFFSLALVFLSALGYRVGLAAHRSSVSWESEQGLIGVLLGAWLLLVCGYFVVLHGLDGRTVGKWLFGLRVVGAERGRVTFGQALIRCLVAALTAPLLLGHLWILWHREKRGWHDLLAGTWVIRERAASGKAD
jgi:uncharacterized RDD family membrane protein YckC